MIQRLIRSLPWSMKLAEHTIAIAMAVFSLMMYETSANNCSSVKGKFAKFQIGDLHSEFM